MSIKMNKRRAAGIAAIGAGAACATTIAMKKRKNGNGSKRPWKRG